MTIATRRANDATTRDAGAHYESAALAHLMAYNVINTNAQPGLLANYSGLFRHRSTTSCFGDISGCTAASPTGVAGE